jgi:cell wall-associated NlpC family hydrolase
MIFIKQTYFIVLLVLGLTIVGQSKEIDHNKDYFNLFIESMAKSKLGKTYKWGGNGPYAYDCSGFTKEVFEMKGIHIPRNSWKQAEVGKKITKKYLKKGDLIFFNSKHESRVNHVGIYLGDGKFIHASKFHKKIVISPFREYRRFFKWGRRLS